MNSFESKPNQEAQKPLDFQDASEKERGILESFIKSGKKARALVAVFALITAACGDPESAGSSNPEGASGAGKTHVETRSFQGYGIQTRQKVEVDEHGNVVRVLEMETPYGKSGR